MKTFFPGGPRQPGKATGRNALDAANALVQRTLAHHGLATPISHPATGPTAAPVGEMGGAASAVASGMSDLMSIFGSPFGGATAQEAAVIDGAEFQQGRFSGPWGNRSYRTYVPASVAQGAQGILLMLHGCTQTAEDFAAGTGMNDLAEAHRLIVIYPQQSRGDNAQSCWNWFSRGDQKRDRGEPAILAAITQQAMAHYGIGRERTFVAGLSAGAAMAVILGETYPDIFSGVGAHSGLPFGAARDVASAFAAMSGGTQEAVSGLPDAAPMRTIVFHGTADSTVHPSNSDRIAQRAMDRGARQTVESEDRSVVAGRQVTRRVSTPPEGRAELEYWVIEGLGHAWSGGRPEGSYTDEHGPDASAEMVRFFLEP